MRVIGLALLLLAIAGEAAAQAPVLKDAERFATAMGGASNAASSR